MKFDVEKGFRDFRKKLEAVRPKDCCRKGVMRESNGKETVMCVSDCPWQAVDMALAILSVDVEFAVAAGNKRVPEGGGDAMEQATTKQVKVRELTADEVEFTLSVEDEVDSVEGHFASGDKEADLKMEADIKSRIASGDTWAWCTVTVKATWRNFEGVDGLGACSYDSEEDFKQVGGYWEDMKSQALMALNANVASAARTVGELLEMG